MLDVTSLFNYFLIKFACFDNIYYYKLMFQMEINANSPSKWTIKIIYI